MKKMLHHIALALFALTAALSPTEAAEDKAAAPVQSTMHKTIKVDGLDIFYREAGPANAPVLLLLHGFPTSSHMFRNLIPALSDRYHVIAPDYPGYGQSSTSSIPATSHSKKTVGKSPPSPELSMTRLFFDQISFESRSRLYLIALFAEERPDDPIPHGGSCFYRVIPLFKYRRTPTGARRTPWGAEIPSFTPPRQSPCRL